ncbi:MAG: hypothetical protein LBI94_00600 [Treponema sp.]|jgi:hypothetical protein|nr:hypothetical protein [Treponema sp.]
MKAGFGVLFALVFGSAAGISHAEELRVSSPGVLELSPWEQAPVSIPCNGAVLISLGEDLRFFRGIEMELIAPPEWLSSQDGLAVSAYADLNPPPDAAAVSDINGRRFLYEPLPGKLRTTYQIPFYEGHGMRSTPYVLVPSTHVPPASFPILFRLIPLVKEISGELAKMNFQVFVRPVLGEDGAVRIKFRYPEQLPGRPFTLLIDDIVIEPAAEFLLKEGEHRLHVLSDDYRDENRLFLVERARTLDLEIELQDPAPLLFFEAPELAHIFLDGRELVGNRGPVPVEPGVHEVHFQVSDYGITRNLRILRGKTYRIVVAMDVDVSESE